MPKRHRSDEEREFRRVMGVVLLKITMGDDSWSEGWGKMISWSVLLIIAMFLFGWLLGTGVANGDLIVEVIDLTPMGMQRRVYAGHDVVVELPRSIGFIGFTQAETHDGVPGSGLAMVGVGPAWFGGFGPDQVPMGAISMQVLNQTIFDVPRVVWDNLHREIGWSEEAAQDGVLWSAESPLPHWVAGDGDPDLNEAPVWIPFQWELFQENTRGSGWVGISQIAQMKPVTGADGVEWITGSGYNIDTVVLAELTVGLKSGEIPDGWAGGGGSGGGSSGAAVPEPSLWAVLTVITAVLILQKQLTSLWLNGTLCVW